MAVFTATGREVVASLLKDQTWFLALGSGDPAWDSAPEEPSASDDDLVAKLGVTRLRDAQFVTPDQDGDITMSDGAVFSVSPDPTRYLYLEFKLDLTDAQGSTFRESGVFHGTEIDGAVPGGQMYIDDADVIDYGVPIQIDRFNSIVHDGSFEQSFTFVLTL